MIHLVVVVLSSIQISFSLKIKVLLLLLYFVRKISAQFVKGIHYFVVTSFTQKFTHTHIKILIYHYTYSCQNLPKTFHKLITLMNPFLMAGNLTLEIFQQVMLML
jgi:hypothetical protein